MSRVMMIIIAVILDWVLGDPYWLPHPIRGIGWLINRLENLLKRTTLNKYLQGGVLWLGVIGSVFGVSWGVIRLAAAFHPLLGQGLEIILLYTAFAARSLDLESKKVWRELISDNLVRARVQLSYLVGRDTENLSTEEVIRGTVETVAENIVDGIISPLFFAFCGGAPLALVYKGINTLDSMVGYKNDKYRELGFVSAKLDDLANYIPARLTGLFIPLAAVFVRKNSYASLKIMLRDRRNHSSPNAGYPESAIAGALEVQLGGTNSYFGQPVVKPTIGDKVKPLETAMVLDTIKIMYLTEVLALIVFSLLFTM